MSPDETAICKYLESWPGEYVSAQQICRQADGRRRFDTDPKWAYVVLTRLVDNGILEADGSGKYRLPANQSPEQAKEKKKPERWISPHIKQILESRGKLPNDDSKL